MTGASTPSCCPTCGADRGERITRGGLTITTSPGAVYWHGKPIPLTPSQVVIMRELARTGQARHLTLQMLGSGPDANPEVIASKISYMRRKLPRELRIESVWGWGYRLTIQEVETRRETRVLKEIA